MASNPDPVTEATVIKTVPGGTRSRSAIRGCHAGGGQDGRHARRRAQAHRRRGRRRPRRPGPRLRRPRTRDDIRVIRLIPRRRDGDRHRRGVAVLPLHRRAVLSAGLVLHVAQRRPRQVVAGRDVPEGARGRVVRVQRPQVQGVLPAERHEAEDGRREDRHQGTQTSGVDAAAARVPGHLDHHRGAPRGVQRRGVRNHRDAQQPGALRHAPAPIGGRHLEFHQQRGEAPRDRRRRGLCGTGVGVQRGVPVLERECQGWGSDRAVGGVDQRGDAARVHHLED